jgi:glycosyltransferase involved in cell wall biosynthesis
LKRKGEIIIGTMAGLRGVKNLPRLVRAVAPLTNARLVIVGEGPEREAILTEASRCGMAERLILPGFLPNPESYAGLFDIFALSSDSEQFPISLVEAMAAGLPAVSTDVGDVRHIVAGENQPYVTPLDDEPAFFASLATLAGDAAARAWIGKANRTLAARDYDAATMIARYAQLYGIAPR